MKALLRLIGSLLKPRNLLVIVRLFRSGKAQQATQAWQRGDPIKPLLPIAVPFLIWIYDRAYRDEQQRLREERVQGIKDEKRKFDQVEHRFVREIVNES